MVSGQDAMITMFSQGLSPFQRCNGTLELSLLFLSTSLYLYRRYVNEYCHVVRVL